MSDSKSLTKIVLIYAIGSLSSRIISFALVFVITFYLTREDVGAYDIIITTVSLITPFIYLQLTDAVLRWLLQENSDGAITPKVSTNIFSMLFLSMAIFSVIYWIAAQLVSVPHKSLVFLVLLAQSILPVFQIFLRGGGKNSLFALSGVVYSVIYTGLTLLFLAVFRLKVEGLLIAAAAAAALTSLFVLVKGRYYSSFSPRLIDIKFSKSLLSYSLPLLPNTLSWWLFSSANRYIVLYFLGLEFSGIWAISYKIPTILKLVNNLVFMGWQEKSFREYNSPNRDRYYTEVLGKYSSLLLGVIIVLTAASKPILSYVVQESFFIAWKYSTWLLLAAYFQDLALFYGVGYFCAKETKLALYTTLAGSISVLALSALLVPFLGLHGAGIATMLGFLVMFVIRLKQTRKYFSITFPLSKAVYMLLGIAVCFALSFSDSLVVQIVNNGVALSVAFFANRKIILGKLRLVVQRHTSKVYA